MKVGFNLCRGSLETYGKNKDILVLNRVLVTLLS